MRFHLLLLLSFLFTGHIFLKAQGLQPGFDKAEYIEMLKVSAAFGDSAYVASFPKPQFHKFVYRSPVVGLDNAWDLWIGQRNTAVISLRGTTANSVSWLANFYAAMVPATGELELSNTNSFSYKLADNPRAAVHVGWLVSMAFLSKDILPKMDSLYKSGIKDFIVLGHSQGGAISYLLTAYLYHLQKQGSLPADLRLKTYCSAASKPGNLYFAYDYETLTQNGWAYNIVNSADWVPEVPISIQTINDFNKTNPFVNVKSMLKKQKFPTNLALTYAFNRLDKPTRRAQRNYEKYLGRMTAKMVKKTLTHYNPPDYFPSNDYVRTGNMIVLAGDSAYRKIYADTGKNIFIHHFHQPYLFLAEKLDLSPTKNNGMKTDRDLGGSWELVSMTSMATSFETLYPGKKPMIIFDLEKNRIAGNTGCNSFSGKLNREGKKISFTEPLVMTKMFCPGEGEQVFIEILKKIDSFSLSENELEFSIGQTAAMRFRKMQ
jgi:heat shock protein HslJ